MKIVVASGKGGVGKSMLASSLALLLSKDAEIVACDCDVDAPNLALWLGTTEYDTIETISVGEKATIINQDTCDEEILDICTFDAIEKQGNEYVINPFLCEGCGTCQVMYPNAISLNSIESADVRTTNTEQGIDLVDAQLFPGETGSGKIVDELKKRADNFSSTHVIYDSAAGIGCPVIASVRGTDYAVLITEPTPSGFSDIKRILDTVNHFNIPYGVVVNKWDINKKLFKKIKQWSGEHFLGRISYDRAVLDSIVHLNPVIYSDSNVVSEIEVIYQKLRERIL